MTTAVWRPVASFMVLLLGGAPWSSAATSDVPLRSDLDQALADFDQAQQIQADHPERARQLFRAAAQRFQSIAAAGVTNGRLEFNTGNAYLQAGQLGRAVLHYLRAHRLMPGDDMLAENLALARSQCLTIIQPTGGGTLLRSVFFWHHGISRAARIRAAIILYVGVWVLLTLRNFLRSPGLTRAAVAFGALSVILAASVAMDSWSDRHAPAGVVLAMDVEVRKGPSTGYQRQFEQPLQPGVEFTLRERRGNWWKIELADGQSGWIDAAHAELVAR